MLQMFGRNATALVPRPAVEPRACGRSALPVACGCGCIMTCGHGVDGILEKIQQDLFDLLAIEQEKGQIRRQKGLQFNTAPRCCGRDEADA